MPITLPEQTAPGTPPAGTVIAYAKADGFWYSKDDAGVETIMSAPATGGLSSLNVPNNTTLNGPTYLVPGTNIGLSQSNASIIFNVNSASANASLLSILGGSDIAGTSGIGTGASAAREDHIHRGVQSLNVPNNVLMFGAAQLSAGTNVSLSQTNTSVVFNVDAASNLNTSPLGTTTPNPVSDVAAVGTGSSSARWDHVHLGVKQLAASGNTAHLGEVYLAGGTNINLVNSAASITINAGSGLVAVANILNIQVFS